MAAPDRATMLRDIDAAVRANNMARAVDLAVSAISNGVETPMIFNVAAYGLELRGDYANALRYLRRGLALAPDDPATLNALGVCLSKTGRSEEALIAFDQAISRAPNYANPYCGRGHALSALGKAKAAARAYDRAIELEPRYAEALASKAMMLLSDARFDEVSDVAERALAIHADEPLAVLAMAGLDAHHGKLIAGEQRIRALLNGPPLTLLNRAGALRLLADILHDATRFDEAMAAYKEANATLRRLHAPNLEAANVEFASDACTRIAAFFEQANPDDWRGAPGATSDNDASHIFLVGFPRSGTTLLEQILASHTDVVTLEEHPTLGEPLRTYFADTTRLERLRTMDAALAEKERTAYWQRVRERGVDVRGKTFVDKMPLNTIVLPLIAKLFPNAKIILAIRDPRDVVLSCFRRRFRATAHVFDYTDFTRTAGYYSAVMKLSDLYRQKLALPIYIHKHEDMIANFDAETQNLCTFLGVDWTDRLRDFVATAKQRTIRTPSAQQVLQGLNASGVGQWRSYGAHFAEVEPILAPWVKSYGYD